MGFVTLQFLETTMLEQWLTAVTKTQIKDIRLGLDRCIQVAKKLNLINWSIPVITVGGTNGKGSTIATLDAIYAKAGYKRLLYTSPHLHRFNERIHINGVPVLDEVFMQAIKIIDLVRENIQLTFFEWVTLAALEIAKKSGLDILLLEVGLGGRLDAVNLVESDLAIITSIALEHTEYLGDTREAIASEKSGIFRQGKPVVCGEQDIPLPMIERANELSAPLFCYGKEYSLRQNSSGWTFENTAGFQLEGQGSLYLKSENLATGLQAAYLLNNRLPVSREVLQGALSGLKLTGRMETKVVQGRIILFDVAHNPQSVAYLAQNLTQVAGRTWAIFSALGSKDVKSMLKFIQPMIDHWLVPQLMDSRAMSLSNLKVFLSEVGLVDYFSSTREAVTEFFQASSVGDRCVVFGSFVTVGSVQADMEKYLNESFI